MTGKLMKYELRGCMRIFLPLWAAVLVLSVINGLTNGNQATVSGVLPRIILFVLPAVALGVLLIGMFAVALVIISGASITGCSAKADTLPSLCRRQPLSKYLPVFSLLA